MNLPLSLVSALESGKCVLFIGAGIGVHMRTGTGHAPTAWQLAQDMIGDFKLDFESDDLTTVASIVEIRRGRPALISYVSSQLASVEPDEILQWVSTVRWHAIFTTNYDDGIERAYELNPSPPQSAFPISAMGDYRQPLPVLEVPIYHLHGMLTGAHAGEIVITDDDYTHYLERRSMLFERLRENFATSTILYVGYSGKDANWKQLFADVRREFAPRLTPHAYRIDPCAKPQDNELLLNSRVETISISFKDFVHDAQLALKDASFGPDLLEGLRGKIPFELQESFKNHSTSVARILQSWTYANHAEFYEKPNVSQFLKGDQPNWALIGAGKYFKRDKEDDIFDTLLDYATGPARTPQSAVVTAPAGYGITTLLMAIAARYVREKVGPVYFLKVSGSVGEGDVEFACRVRPNAITLFVIDDASEHLLGIRRAIECLKKLKLPAFFLLGTRTNEWAQARGQQMGKRFSVEDLSDNEIDSLLSFLRVNGALNKLEPLSPELQIAAVKSRLGKNLLVTMRESTEGQGFDAIIESEYHGIHSEKGKEAYLAVCALHQFGAAVRVEILAAMLSLDIAAMYSLVNEHMEGVIIFDTLDESAGAYLARARHRFISQMVWERCGDAITKSHYVTKAISCLNIGYSTDKKAFDALVRSDRLIDSLRTLDDKIRFFDTAVRKEPDNAFVLQHYARMFLRANLTELAGQKIEAAFETAKRSLDYIPRVLYHTKGTVLARLAVEAEGTDVGRKRMAQSESSFRSTILADPKDAYGYTGLASLFLSWAQRINDHTESSLYVSKCEQVISEALLHAREKDSLWILSSEVSDFVNNQPERVAALRNAVRTSPNSIIARYLLARQLRRQGDSVGACNLLKDTVANHPNEFRSSIEYALALYETDGNIEQAIAVIRLGDLYGNSDSRFIATKAGLLFIAQKYSEAQQVFQIADVLDLQLDEQRIVLFRPKNFSNGLIERRTGRVSSIHSGHAMLNVPGIPRRIILPAKFYGTVRFSENSQLEFDLVFTVKGPMAENPTASPTTSRLI